MEKKKTIQEMSVGILIGLTFIVIVAMLLWFFNTLLERDRFLVFQEDYRELHESINHMELENITLTKRLKALEVEIRIREEYGTGYADLIALQDELETLDSKVQENEAALRILIPTANELRKEHGVRPRTTFDDCPRPFRSKEWDGRCWF